MLTKLIILLNALASSIAGVLLAPVAWLPGWLSLSLIAAVTGVLMLLVFKYTSNQRAIKSTRNQIKANILALSLYRDSVAVSLRAQGRILSSAVRLMFHSLVPMFVMTVPTVLLLGQLAVWYQVRPLKTGEEAVVTVQLIGNDATAFNELKLVDSSAIRSDVGPVRVPSKQIVCWNVIAAEAGNHTLTFEAAGKQFTKNVVVGNGYLRTSIQRPAQEWSELLLHPWESPFPEESVVQSIEITYPERSSWTSGTTTWLPFWFVISMVAAFAAKPFLNVNI
jgi:uncharacterized membrane protein (DUF106 family)